MLILIRCFLYLLYLHLSLHDALPICSSGPARSSRSGESGWRDNPHQSDRYKKHSILLRSTALSGPPAEQRSHWHCCASATSDRKSTRLNSSHVRISYAVFCLKKKNTT